MKPLHTLLFLLVCGFFVFASACTARHTSSNEERAIAIARDTLREHKLKPEDFDPPEVHYNTNKQHWAITFWPKSRIIDGDVFIVVDDKTGKIISASHGLGHLE